MRKKAPRNALLTSSISTSIVLMLHSSAVSAVLSSSTGTGIPVILQTSPENYYDGQRRIHSIVTRIAQEEHADLLDQAALFRNLDRRTFISRDDFHCNEYGYGLMARHLYDFIKKHYPSIFQRS